MMIGDAVGGVVVRDAVGGVGGGGLSGRHCWPPAAAQPADR